MSKKWKLALLTLFFSILLAGCVDVDFHLTINSDGTGTIKVKMVGNEMVAPALMESYEQDKADLEKEGYKVNKVEEDGKKGFEAVKEINLKDLQSKTSSKSDNDPLSALDKNNFKYNYEEGLFFNTHKVEGNFDLKDMAASSGLDQTMLDQLNFRFLVTLPTSTDKHNATSVEGNTLIWKLKPGEDNRFYFEANVPNWTTWGIVIAIALVVIGIIVWLVMRNKSNTPPLQAAGVGGAGGTVPTQPIQPAQPTVQPDQSKTQDSFNWDED